MILGYAAGGQVTRTHFMLKMLKVLKMLKTMSPKLPKTPKIIKNGLLGAENENPELRHFSAPF